MSQVARLDGSGWHRPQPWIRLTLFLIVGMGSVIAYVLLAMTINAEPSSTPFPGWVTVIQPVRESEADRIALSIISFWDDPSIDYSVTVCGRQPFTGQLIIGGKAKLTHVSITGNLAPQRLTALRNLSNLDTTLGELGAVQVLPLSTTHPHSCGRITPFSLAGPKGVDVVGEPSAEIKRSWLSALGLWDSPHINQAWPLASTMPIGREFFNPPPSAQAVGIDRIGTYGGLNGNWRLPPVEVLGETLDVPLAWSVVNAQPPVTESSNTLSWSSMTAVQPVAQLTNISRATALQDWLVIAAVGMGISGSMLASLVFQWLHPISEQRVERLEGQSVSTLRSAPRQPIAERIPPAAAAIRITVLAWIIFTAVRRRRQARRL